MRKKPTQKPDFKSLMKDIDSFRYGFKTKLKKTQCNDRSQPFIGSGLKVQGKVSTIQIKISSNGSIINRKSADFYQIILSFLHFSTFMTRNKKRPIVTSFTTSKKVSDSRKSKQMTGADPYFKVGLEVPPSQERCAMLKSQGLLSSFYVVNIMIFQPFQLQHTQKLIKLHNFLNDDVRNDLNFFYLNLKIFKKK